MRRNLTAFTLWTTTLWCTIRQIILTTVGHRKSLSPFALSCSGAAEEHLLKVASRHLILYVMRHLVKLTKNTPISGFVCVCVCVCVCVWERERERMLLRMGQNYFFPKNHVKYVITWSLRGYERACAHVHSLHALFCVFQSQIILNNWFLTKSSYNILMSLKASKA